MKTNGILLTILILFILSACQTDEPREMHENPVRVETMLVHEEEIALPIHSSGKLYAESELKLGFKTGGIIQQICVEEGQSVKKGQLLAQLDLSEIQSRVLQTKLALDKAKRDYLRAKSLYEDSVATLEQFQNAKTAFNYAESNYTIAQFNLKHSKIIAPSDGKILKLLAEQNEISAPGYPVLLFGSTEEAYIVRINVTDGDIFKIMPNDSAHVEFDAYPNRQFEALVSEIGRAADPYTGTFEVELKLNDPNVELASGLISYTNLYPSKKESFALIPTDALVSGNNDLACVYALSEKNTVMKLSLKVNTMTDENIIAYAEGLNGKKIIVNGHEYLSPGDKVETEKEVFAFQTEVEEN